MLPAISVTRAAGKQKTVFACAECGQQSPKWLGQCPSCRQWNTLHEEVASREPRGGGRGAFDLRRRDDGVHVFLEVNPAGQWLYVEEATGLPITAAVARLLAGR